MSDTWNPAGTTLIQTDDGERARVDDDAASEFDRTEDLASTLVQVTKDEVGEKRKKS